MFDIIVYIISLLFGVYLLGENLVYDLKYNKKLDFLLDKGKKLSKIDVSLLSSYVLSWILENKVYIILPFLFVPFVQIIVILYIIVEFNKRYFIKFTQNFFIGYVKGLFKLEFKKDE